MTANTYRVIEIVGTSTGKHLRRHQERYRPRGKHSRSTRLVRGHHDPRAHRNQPGGALPGAIEGRFPTAELKQRTPTLRR